MPNMLYHHLSDIDHDAKSNTQTFGRSYPDLSKKMIKAFSLIIVLSIFSALVYAASEFLDHAYIFWIVSGLLGWVEFTVTNRSLPSYLLWIYTKWFMARQVLFAFLCVTHGKKVPFFVWSGIGFVWSVILVEISPSSKRCGGYLQGGFTPYTSNIFFCPQGV